VHRRQLRVVHWLMYRCACWYTRDVDLSCSTAYKQCYRYRWNCSQNVNCDIMAVLIMVLRYCSIKPAGLDCIACESASNTSQDRQYWTPVQWRGGGSYRCHPHASSELINNRRTQQQVTVDNACTMKLNSVLRNLICRITVTVLLSISGLKYNCL